MLCVMARSKCVVTYSNGLLHGCHIGPPLGIIVLRCLLVARTRGPATVAQSDKIASRNSRRYGSAVARMPNKGMNAEPPTARSEVVHQPRRPGYAKRYVAGDK